jgi:hypothetical protein
VFNPKKIRRFLELQPNSAPSIRKLSSGGPGRT